VNQVDQPGRTRGFGGRRDRAVRAGMVLALALATSALSVVPARALEFWVDGSTGDDARSPIQAQSKATPWKTIVRALETVTAGHSIRVRPGTYAGRLESEAPGVSLVADGGPGSVVVTTASGATGLLVTHADVVVSGFSFEGGLRGVRSLGSSGLVLRDVSVSSHSGDGLVLESSPGVRLERVSVAGGTAGISVAGSPEVGLLDVAVSGASRESLVIADSPGAILDGIVLAGGSLGLRLSGSDSAVVRDLAVDRTGRVSGDGLAIESSPRTQVLRATLDGGGDALRIEASDGVALAEILAGGPSGVGLSVTNAAGVSIDGTAIRGGTVALRAVGAGGLRVSDLSAEGQSFAGVDLESSPETSLERVVLGPATGLAGVAASACDGLVLRDATILGAATAPLAIDTSAGVIVQRVTVVGGVNALSADLCADLDLLDFAASGHSGTGVVVTGSPGATLDGVTLDRGAAGIRVSGSDGASLRRATVERVPGVALSVDGSTSPTVDGAVLRLVGTGLDLSGGPGATVRKLSVEGVVGVGASIVSAAGARIEDCSFDEGSYGLRVQSADGVTVVGVRATGQRVAGISIADAARAVVANSIVRDSGGHGILVERGAPAYLRNNLVADASGWGIAVDDSALPAVTTGHVLSFNTVVRSGAALDAGGMLLARAIGEVRDNLLAENVPVGLRIDTAGAVVHHDLVWGSPEPVSPEGYGIGGGMVYADPAFAPGDAANPFALSQVAAGQAVDSPAVDAGSAGVVSRDIGGSTRTDLAEDEGFADLGFHSGAPPPGVAPLPVKPTTLWVNCATGDDLRGRTQADSSLSPLRTISRALSIAVEGDRIVVQDGVCRERATVDVPGISLEAENAGGVVVEAPVDQAGLRVRASRVNVFGFVVRSAKEGVVVASKDSSTRLLLVRLRNLRVEGPGGGPDAFVATNGIRLVGVDRSRVESCEVRRALQQGIVARNSGRMWIRNNLVVGSGEWGIHVDNGDGMPAIPSGNLVLFNTVDGNGAGGIRFQRATGEIGWNVVSFNVGPGIKVDDGPVWIHHANLFGNGLPIFSEPENPPVVWSLVPGDPAFVDRDAGVYALRQVAAGQAADSPAVDAAGVRPGRARIKGSTRTDGVADAGMADLGYHATRKKLGSRPTLEVPPDDGPRSLHVDAATGDDARSALDAVDPLTPWRTIARAFAPGGARTGDTVRVAPGIYDGGLATIVPGVSLLGTGSVEVLAPTDGAGISVGHADTRVEGLRFVGGRHGVAAGGASGLVVRDVSIADTKKDAMVIESSPGASLERIRVDGGNALLRVTGSDGVVVRDLDAGEHEAEGVVLADSAGALLERVVVAGGRTVVAATNSPGLVVRDLAATAIRGDGITLSAAAGARIERVSLGARDAALRVADAPDLVVSDLEASGHEDEGVVVTGSDGAAFADVTLSGGSRGLVLSSGAGMKVERASLDGARGGVVADGAAGLVLRDLGMTDLATTAISLASSPDATLERVSTAGGEDVLAVVGSPRLAVAGLDATGHSGAGVSLSTSGESTFSGLRLLGGASLFVADLSPGIELSDARASDLVGHAVGLASCADSSLEDVASTGGIDALRATSSPRLSVTGLSASGHAGLGVRLASSDSSRLEDVTLDGGTGGLAAALSPGLAVVAMDVRGATGPGVDLESSPGASIDGLAVEGGSRGVVVSGCAGSVLEDLTVTGPLDEAVALADSTGTRVERLRVVDAGGDAVAADGCTDLRLRDVLAEGHAGSAVRLVESPGALVEDVTAAGGTHGVRGDGVDGIVVRKSAFAGAASDGVLLVGATGAVVDDVRVEDAGASGISIARGSSVYVRNNRVARTGEWGISIDNSAPPEPPSLDGNVVAFNTVWSAARTSSTAGGVRFAAASGEIRDNVIVAVGGSVVKTDLAPTVVHHNVLDGGARPFDSKSGQEPIRRANRLADPLLVDPDASDFSLRQRSSGQPDDSPGLDAGSGIASILDIGGSTRTDGALDDGRADAGWHAEAPAASTPPPIAFVSPPGLGNTLHVDVATGDDERGYDAAQDGSTPVRSARRAMALAAPGDVVVLGAGTYAEAIEVAAEGVVLRGAGDRGDVIVQPPDGEIGIAVDGHDDVTIENLIVEGGSRGVLATEADRLRLFRVGSVVPEFVGLEVRDGEDATIDSCLATGAGSHGLQLRRSSGYVRNNLVYANGEWGISVDASGLAAPVSGVAVAFNTVHANHDGIRMVNAGGEVRDNLLTEQVDLGLYLAGPNLLAHHNDFSANGRDRDQESEFADSIRVWASIDGNPRYRDPSGPDDVLGLEGWQDDDFRLRQLPGETPASPMVDAGSGPVAELDIGGSTRSDGVPDAGVADLGFHVDAPAASTPPPFATPPAEVASTYYVSSVTGFDGRSSASARRRETPWASIGRALQAVEPGDSIVVLPGRYAETVQVVVPGVSVVSEDLRGAVLAPTAGNGVTVEAADVTIRGFVVEGAPNHGVSVLDGADRVEIRGCALVRSSANGLLAKGVSGLVVEDVVIASSGLSGLVLRNTTGSTLRDVLSYENGEWGANVHSVVTGVVSTGHLVERGTFAFNGLGGLRMARASGTIRDNLLTNTPGVGLRIDTAGSLLLHNGFFATGQEMDPDTYILSQCTGCAANLVLDPAFVDPDGKDGVRGGVGWADDDFRLSQIAAGQDVQSEAVDAGSFGTDGLGPVGSTRTDGQPDGGILDLGAHR